MLGLSYGSPSGIVPWCEFAQGLFNGIKEALASICQSFMAFRRMCMERGIMIYLPHGKAEKKEK